MKEHQEAEASQAQQQQQVLSLKVLLEVLGKLSEVLDLIEENYPDVQRSLSVSGRVLANYGCYQEMLGEKQQKTVQMTITSFFKRRDKQEGQQD